MGLQRKHLEKAWAKELYDRGLCDQDIADMCAVSREAVRSWRRRNGLPGNTPPPKKEKCPPNANLIAAAAEAKKHRMTYGKYMLAKEKGEI